MRLIVGKTVISDSRSDGVTRWIRAEKPTLNLRADSTEIVGMRFARNRSNGFGLVMSFTVRIGRQFKSYQEAEYYTLKHLAEFADGLEGVLKYEDLFGYSHGFENAALESVDLASEIGISTEFIYRFKCGKPIDNFSRAVVVNNRILTVNGIVMTVNI